PLAVTLVVGFGQPGGRVRSPWWSGAGNPTLLSWCAWVTLPSPSPLHSFVDRGDPLASTDAHGDKRILTAGATEFVQGFYRQDTARCPDGVSKRNAAPVRVRAIKRQIQIPHYSQSLGSES